jgi:signal transduction histidine kinase
MSIKRTLIGAAIVAAIIVAGSITFLVVLTGRAKENERTLTITSEVRRDISSLGLLAGEFALSHSEDLHARWSDTLSRLEGRLGGLPQLRGAAGVQYSRIAGNIAVLKGLGAELEALHSSMGDLESGGDQVSLTRRDLLLRRMYVSDADSLGAAIAGDQLVQSGALNDAGNLRAVFWSVLALLALLAAGVIVILWAAVFRPVAHLSYGVATVGSGNLNHRVGTKSRSEIGRLSRAFDDMTQNLQSITVSRDALEREVVRREAAEQAQDAALSDLHRSNQDLEQFAYVASHDLQEPLRMVASYTQLLAQKYGGQLDDKAQSYIHYAVDGATRMQGLINDLLTYSRVNTQGRPLEPTDSHAVLGEALRNLTVSIEESGAIVTNDDLPVVRADASQLQQVFQNLIGNAIKFRGKTSPHVHVAARKEGREWLFSVMDNGIGIDPQHAERLFVIFQRLHTRQEYQGTGIGLAVCKRIVERHGGSIWFESEPGKGSTFYFTLPA